VLIGGLRRWQELVLLRKVNLGVFDEHELQAFGDCLRELHEKHQGLLARLETIADASNKARPRSNWKRLLTDGILVGSRNDDHHLEGIRAGRRLLLQSSESSRTPKSLPSADQGSTHLNGRS
jgi:hypothetical protein